MAGPPHALHNNAASKPLVIVITGASSGVGRAIARAFGRGGHRVALLARGRAGLAVAAFEIRQAGGDALALPLDLADARAVDEAADRVVREWGGIDVWVNNAMVSVFAPVSQMTAVEYRRVTEVNYLGTVHGTLAALRHMRKRNAGTIIQIGSALAYRSIPLQSAYCASKAAIRAFTDSLRSELIHERSGIALTMVQLPAVNTPHFDVVRNKLGHHARPLPPIYQPEVIAEAVMHAVDHPRRELWVGWSTIKAIVAQMVAPGRLDALLAQNAWDAQATPDPPPRYADNLFSPLPGDRGAHGAFDDEARSFSTELWAVEHGKKLALLVGGVLGLWAFSKRRWRKDGKTDARTANRRLRTHRQRSRRRARIARRFDRLALLAEVR